MEVQKSRFLVRLMFVVALSVQSSCSESAEDVDVCANRTASLVGDTMSSINNVPFVWAPEYEVAIVYITSTWSEIATFNSSAEDAIAKEAFLSYCVRFKNNMFNFMKKLHDDPNANKKVKKAINKWYQAVDSISKKNWFLPVNPDLRHFQVHFPSAFKHLLMESTTVSGEAAGENTNREVNDFTLGIAQMMIELVKRISKQIRDIPKQSNV